MVIYSCGNCNYTGGCKRDLERHLQRKYGCSDAPFSCSKCDRPFHRKNSMYRHQKICTGPAQSPEDELKQRIEDLEEEIKILNTPVIEETSIVPVGFGKLADAIKPQFYVGLPGELLIPVIPTEFTIVKFGSTKEPEVRIPRHNKDFGGFILLDSIVCDNPAEVEDKLRDWLRINNKLIKGKTINKNTTDTELFVVKDQVEYETIVRIAKTFADELTKRVDDRAQRELDLERQRLEYEKKSLEMERELMKLRTNP